MTRMQASSSVLSVLSVVKGASISVRPVDARPAGIIAMNLLRLPPIGRGATFLLGLMAGIISPTTLCAAVPGADDNPVSLPPFIVEEAAKGPPWRYAETPGYEILSRCNDAITRR